MGARYLSVLPLCLACLGGRAEAQTAPPPTSAATTIPTIEVFATTPLSSSGMDPDKVPAAVTTVRANDIQRTDSLNITDALVQRVPGVIINEVAGNPFQPDVQFRGFTASPVAGTPQGLAVYQNGVRINEAFGDTVNWDLIPTLAIQSVDVVTNNPAFGLNALGGALNIRMKDGFSYQGAEANVMGGSYGRVQGGIQWGKKVDNFAVYGAFEGLRDDGYRNFSQSTVRRFYGDVGYRNDVSEFHLNMGFANNNFGAAATVPVELLQARGWGATYTTPQTSSNRVGYLNLTGKVEATPSWTLEGNAHVRRFSQRTQDGNPTGTVRCDDPTLLCFDDDDVPAYGLNGQQLSNPFPANAILGENDRTSTRSTSSGVTLQATNTDQVFGLNNRFVVGGSVDYGVTQFNASAELGTLGPDYVLTGSGIYLGKSGDPISIGPVSLRTTNLYGGLYALDTLDLTDRFSLTAGGRFNTASIKLRDQIGTELNGDNDFSRFNPIVGGTYKIMPWLSAYAGYSEANRAPTPLELGCADPARPCTIAAFLVSDPPLKQVVSRTVEAGFRGSHDFGPDFGRLGWKLGVFRADNKDDILAIPSELQGFGYFQNVGSTRREGVEAELNLKASRFELYASYTYIDARFRDALTLQSNSPSADNDGVIQVLPGNQIPSIPRHRVKAGVDVNVTDAFRLGGDMLFVSSQYFDGDGSNQEAKLGSYTVFNLHGSYQINKTFQVFARVDNLLDNRYYSFGTFFERDAVPNFATGADFVDARSVSPARPRAFYAGLRARF